MKRNEKKEKFFIEWKKLREDRKKLKEKESRLVDKIVKSKVLEK